jgi:secreted PhoX family phosphatase
MKQFLLSALALSTTLGANAQLGFDPSITWVEEVDTVYVNSSVLQKQVIFIGGYHDVQTTQTYGNAAGAYPAKQWHDFIGFTPDNSSSDLGWLSINHEMVLADPNIGDGGGMTVFKIARDANTDSIVVVSQTLSDGRTGEFFNVDFANTVGETGMNCGGIQSEADGRIWTAEEWWRNDNAHIYDDGDGVTDTANFTITGSGITGADGQTIEKYQNFNYMVEIDPEEAVAIRKQYNWGRQPFEGGVVMPDNKTVYLGGDATPGILTKFVATTAGDFTDGTTYFYKADAPGKWVSLDMTQLDNILNYQDSAIAHGATMFNRLEWVAYGSADGHVYLTETGRDNPAGSWNDELADGGVFAQHHIDRAADQGVSGPDDGQYEDLYGRIIRLNTTNDSIEVFMEGGPSYAADVPVAQYPEVHLSNPDGLGFGTFNGQEYMLICEDLNGTSNGRMPQGYTNRTCELFMLDMSIANPTYSDLIRIAETPIGAEITGVRATPDGKTIFFNSQHPSSANPFPYDNSCTIALTGFDQDFASQPEVDFEAEEFKVYPNPTADYVYINRTTDVAIYDIKGDLINVYKNTNKVRVAHLPAGTYLIMTAEGDQKKLIKE